jgi:histidinol-phosphate/aromatic aminotransferase/cobyric acid decarboxylase-like protein
MPSKKHAVPDLKKKPYGGAWCIDDHEQTQEIYNIIEEHSHSLCDFVPEKFLSRYASWFQSTHNIKGVATFDGSTVSNGTTETFDKWYLMTNQRRLRLLKGEYFYHQIAAREVYKSFRWIEDGPIQNQDVVVISCPFADTGNIPMGFDSIMQQCEDYNVPVLVDMAYINLAQNLSIDLSYNCIKVVTTSMSKVFPVPHYRIGMRLTKGIDDDLMIAYQQNNYVNRFSCGLGYHLMEKFTADHTFEKYRDKQIALCEKLEVQPSASVLFGIDNSDRFGEYSRGGKSNRLCFSKQLSEG